MLGLSTIFSKSFGHVFPTGGLYLSLEGWSFQWSSAADQVRGWRWSWQNWSEKIWGRAKNGNWSGVFKCATITANCFFLMGQKGLPILCHCTLENPVLLLLWRKSRHQGCAEKWMVDPPASTWTSQSKPVKTPKIWKGKKMWFLKVGDQSCGSGVKSWWYHKFDFWFSFGRCGYKSSQKWRTWSNFHMLLAKRSHLFL